MNEEIPDIECASQRDMTVAQAEERRNARHEGIARATGFTLHEVKELARQHRLHELYDPEGRLMSVPRSAQERQRWLQEHRFPPAPAGGYPRAAQTWLEQRRTPPVPSPSDLLACRIWLEANK